VKKRSRHSAVVKSYCPDFPRCHGSQGQLPRGLEAGELARIQEQIERDHLSALPELGPGEQFFICRYCGVVWQGSSSRKKAVILGWLDSSIRGGGWHRYDGGS
jgi:hypothetical protein